MFLFLYTGFTLSLKEKMKYKIIETEKGQREKVYKGNTMLYKKTKIEHDTNITEYEMVVILNLEYLRKMKLLKTKN